MVRPTSSAALPSGSFLSRMGFAPYASGHGSGGKGKSVPVPLKRHRRILRDNIQGVTKGDIRRLARRGGVKRISGMIYDDTRAVLKQRLTTILQECCTMVQYRNRKTVTVTDVVFVLNRLGTPIYGFGNMNGSGRGKID